MGHTNVVVDRVEPFLFYTPFVLRHDRFPLTPFFKTCRAKSGNIYRIETRKTDRSAVCVSNYLPRLETKIFIKLLFEAPDHQIFRLLRQRNLTSFGLVG